MAYVPLSQALSDFKPVGQKNTSSNQSGYVPLNQALSTFKPVQLNTPKTTKLFPTTSPTPRNNDVVGNVFNDIEGLASNAGKAIGNAANQSGAFINNEITTNPQTGTPNAEAQLEQVPGLNVVLGGIRGLAQQTTLAAQTAINTTRPNNPVNVLPENFVNEYDSSGKYGILQPLAASISNTLGGIGAVAIPEGLVTAPVKFIASWLGLNAATQGVAETISGVKAHETPKQIGTNVVKAAVTGQGSHSGILGSIFGDSPLTSIGDNIVAVAGIPLAALGIAKITTGKVNGKTQVTSVEAHPQVVQQAVLENKAENTPLANKLLKASVDAQKNDHNVLIQSSDNGNKVDVTTMEPSTLEDIKSQETPTKTNLNVTPNEVLPQEHQAIETNFTNNLENNYQEHVQKYNSLPETQGGKVLSADIAKDLDTTYANNKSLSSAVHEPASAFIKQLYKDKLAEPIKDGKDMVLFTAGGTGAGKTTALESIPAMQQLTKDAGIIVDTNSAKDTSSISKVQQALNAGRQVVLTYVHRDPVEAFENGVLPRAMKVGRIVPIDTHINTHLGALASILKVADHFKNNPNVEVRVIDNTHGKGNAVIMPLDRLRSLSYNRDELRQELNNSLNKQYETNKINETVYNATKARSEKTITEGASGQNSTRNDQKSQSTSDQLQSVKKQLDLLPQEEKTPEHKALSDIIDTLLSKKESGEGIDAAKTFVKLAKPTSFGEFIHQVRVAHTQFDSVFSELYNDINRGDITREDYVKFNQEIKQEGNNNTQESVNTSTSQSTEGQTGRNAIQNGSESQTTETSQSRNQSNQGGNGSIKESQNNQSNNRNESESSRNTGRSSEQHERVQQSNERQRGSAGASRNGELRTSSAQKHLLERLVTTNPERYQAILDRNGEIKYNVNHAKNDLDYAAKMIEKNPQKAYDIAMGYQKPAGNHTANAMAILLEEQAAREKNYDLVSQLERTLTLRSTHYGQENAALRGRNQEGSATDYMNQIVKSRINKLGSINVGTKIANKFSKVNVSTKERARSIIDKQAKDLQNRLHNTQAKIRLAQNILDQLTCK